MLVLIGRFTFPNFFFWYSARPPGELMTHHEPLLINIGHLDKKNYKIICKIFGARPTHLFRRFTLIDTKASTES